MTNTNEKAKQQLREKLATGESVLVLSKQMSESDARTIAAEVGRESDMVVISPSMPGSRVTDTQASSTLDNTNNRVVILDSE